MADPLRNRILAASRVQVVGNGLFSLWVDPGVEDQGSALHSLGVSWWHQMGAQFGLTSLADFPAPSVGPYGAIGGDVRSDGVWLHPATHAPIALIEYERYQGGDDQVNLVEKARNLLLASHRWQMTTGMAILSFWTKGIANAPECQRLQSIIERGFDAVGAVRVPGAPGVSVLLMQFLHRERLGRWGLHEVIERGGAS